MERKAIHELLKMMGAKNIMDREEWVSCSCLFAPWKHAGKRDRNPSFGISVGKASFFNCFGCHMKDDIRMLPTAYSRYNKAFSTDKVRAFIAKKEGLFAPASEDEVKPKTMSVISEKELSTFSKLRPVRGLSQKTIDRYGLRYDSKEDRMVIPIRDIHGRLVTLRGRYMGRKESVLRYREYSELSCTSPKSAGIWFGMHDKLKPNKHLVLVEGEIDAMLLKQEGISNVWGAMGSALSKAQIQTLRGVSSPVLLFFDNDEAGHSSMKKIVTKLAGLTPLYHISNYRGVKDAGEAVDKGILKKVLRGIDKFF